MKCLKVSYIPKNWTKGHIVIFNFCFRCNFERTCSIAAKNNNFGDPCFGIEKYLEVDYTCIPAKQLTLLIITRVCNFPFCSQFQFFQFCQFFSSSWLSLQSPCHSALSQIIFHFPPEFVCTTLQDHVCNNSCSVYPTTKIKPGSDLFSSIYFRVLKAYCLHVLWLNLNTENDPTILQCILR